MKITIGKIELLDKAKEPKIELSVSFSEEKEFANQTGSVRVLLDYQNYTVEELKTAAKAAAKELLIAAAHAINE